MSFYGQMDYLTWLSIRKDRGETLTEKEENDFKLLKIANHYSYIIFLQEELKAGKRVTEEKLKHYYNVVNNGI